MKTLDREEKLILSAFEAGKLRSTVTSEAVLRRYREYARGTLSKNKRVNSRLSTPDLSEIRARAAEEGIPYACQRLAQVCGGSSYRKAIASHDTLDRTRGETPCRLTRLDIAALSRRTGSSS